ncbi:hypothetical protein WBP06_04105 [Novosphingobium sp. BL-8H]|uniref:hypothetical protein n=1 Tax=Novosphingobium sp. BL-8H TaxID=3127640 RepID=UPI003757E611
MLDINLGDQMSFLPIRLFVQADTEDPGDFAQKWEQEDEYPEKNMRHREALFERSLRASAHLRTPHKYGTI